MTGKPVSDRIEVVFFDLGDTLVRSRDRSWVPGAAELLAELRDAGLRLGIISNTGNLDRDQLAALLPADFEWDTFEAGLVLLSSEVGVEKPGEEIFILALERAGRPGRACLFCTENLAHTLVAQRLSYQVARLDPSIPSDFAALRSWLVPE